ncbi:F-box/LRR-repeat protein At2g42730-like isoform X2 [Actinidia eriantha]|uniref:F-box/LRR-repeat protein At2g42730-like isoform X2 n=1 Tax=Actinidia eriantha TaxID=165200 RepID=UPI002583A284|nr:F-box/LRR-repeat protein At2g42730-like isoform X2 [Actinidia eriantha]
MGLSSAFVEDMEKGLVLPLLRHTNKERSIKTMKRKFGENDNYIEDRISALPDEIISSILSLLTITEAGRTSVLAHRWKNLWNLFTGRRLDFDGSKTMVRIIQKIRTIRVETEKTKVVETERAKYVNWVNQVLNFHHGQNIDEFRVCFDLDTNYACVVDKWINFAIERGVQRLFLDLRRYNESYQGPKCFTFPSSLLSGLGLNTLTSLSLQSVELTEDVLAHILSNCPLIEEISLKSPSLVNVIIEGPPKLMYFELRYCMNLRNLEISATNLISFKYFGPIIENPFKNVPLLSEVSIGGDYGEELVHRKFHDLSGVLSQIKRLVLEFDYMVCYSSHYIPKTFPEFRNLKQLELDVGAVPDQNILFLAPLIDVSPCLYRLVVKVKLEWECRCPGEPRENINGLLESLKVVEIVGWVGHTTDIQLATYLLEKAVLLETIIIDPRSPYATGRYEFEELAEKGKKDAARERAKQLEAKLPSCTKLVIL